VELYYDRLYIGYTRSKANRLLRYGGPYSAVYVNTLWTGDADLRLYITTVQDG